MKLKTFFAVAAMALAAVTALPAQAAEEKQPAFPGAEGYGRYVTGGRGGKVLYVTSLEDDGSVGTLRWAVEQNGTRTIMFKVSGNIFLKSELVIRNGNVTIAGQSAPGDGICVGDYPVAIRANNVIVRYMRFRLGNTNVKVSGADGWDGFGGFDQENIMIDHCSVSWSIDECLSVLGNKNTTVQWCISSHSLVNAGHSKGAHGYGGNWGGDHASFHHNLMAHHVSRTPRLGPRPSTQLREHMDMRNNVIYNWAGNGCYGGEGMDVNIVNNYYKPGPATNYCSSSVQQRIAGVGVRTTEYITTYPDYAPAWHLWGHYFVDGNKNTKYTSVTNNNWSYGFINQISSSENDGTFTDVTKDTIKLAKPLQFIYTTTHTADAAYEKVLDYVGCSLSRDSYDAEVIGDVREGKASHTGDGLRPGQINSQSELVEDGVSPWPELKSTAAPVDTDGDGMPDYYEDNNNLDPSDPSDGAKTASNGYTNLENYLNGIVASITAAQNAGGEALGDIEEKGEEPEVQEFEISAQTSKGNGTFESNGVTFTGSGSLLTATTASYYMKASRNADYTLKISDPNLEIVKAVVDGFCNGDNQTGYVWKVGNLTLGSKGAANEYVLPARNLADHIKEYTFTFSTPVKGSFLIACTGENQCALRVKLYTGPTGVKGVKEVKAPQDNDVYTMDGRLVLRDAAQWQIEALPKGAYIVGGKKMMKGE